MSLCIHRITICIVKKILYIYLCFVKYKVFYNDVSCLPNGFVGEWASLWADVVGSTFDLVLTRSNDRLYRRVYETRDLMYGRLDRFDRVSWTPCSVVGCASTCLIEYHNTSRSLLIYYPIHFSI